MKSACWKTLEKLAGLTYYSSRALSLFQLQHASKRFSGPPLLIYQMGKVGSQTVEATLNNLNLDMPIYHIHHLTHDYIAEREKRYRKYFHSRDTSYTDFDMLWKYQYLRRKLDKGLAGKKWKIVTLVRDPVAVNVSSFFHQFNEVEPLVNEKQYRIKSIYFDFDTIVALEDMGLLLKMFLEKVDHDEPLSFFDDELKKVFGIDVFAHEFSQSEGFEIYHGDLADVLLIRLENLNACAETAFKEFLHIGELALIHTNIGSRKAYAPIYKAFKDSVIMPDSYLDRMYSSRYVRHFYSEEEISRFKERWGSSKKLTVK